MNPYELFLIFHQIVSAKRDARNPGVQKTAESIAYMIDQSHCIEPKIPAMIRSVLNCQTQYAKALLVNFAALEAAQARQDVLGAESAVREAFEQDVTPLLESIREEKGLPPDPMKAFHGSGYLETIAKRGSGGMGW